MNEHDLLTNREAGVLRLTLNRPDRLNAVSEAMYAALLDALAEADADAEVRCVVLSGAGRAFCVGADLKEHGAGRRDESAREHYVQLGQDVCARIQTIGTPVIAAVHGYAVGAGAEIAVSADFLLIAADARLRFPEISIGTFIGGGVSDRLPRIVGLRRATALLMSGDWFTGAVAEAWGLANSAPAAEELRDAVDSLAAGLAGKAPLSVRALKRRLADPEVLQAALDAEAEALLGVMRSRDWAEGVAAFAEKREPNFTGT
ncbi:MAG: enoyl-CoA hydratase/isomerase family protein [Solirubrobacteraceae bacterium]